MKKSTLIRKAALADLAQIKALADNHKFELGFIRNEALKRSIEREEVIIALCKNKLIGFVEYHHRKDLQTTLYHIVIKTEHRGCKIGEQLVEQLIKESKFIDQKIVILRCPADLEANKFYHNFGFDIRETENGKKRKLIVWQYNILGNHKNYRFKPLTKHVHISAELC